MNLPYIINVALILLVCLAFYKLLLRRETFYKVNRYMLVICLAISFSLPLLQVPQQFSFRKPAKEVISVPNSTMIATDQLEQNTTPSKATEQKTSETKQPAAIDQSSTGNNQSQTSNIKSQISFSQVLNWLFWLYWFGVVVFGI